MPCLARAIFLALLSPFTFGASVMPAFCAPAERSASAREFKIDAKPLPQALDDFALQANISISESGHDLVSQTSRPLYGHFTIEEGLAQLLQGTSCTFEIIDAKTVRVLQKPLGKNRETSSEIIVTATKLPTPIDQLPNSVSFLSGQQVRARGLAQTRDVAMEFAGVTVTNLGAGRNKILIRGMSDGALTGNTQSTVGIYLDDSRLTYNAPDPDLALVDIDEIEILRGPQGSLYGAGSIGGIYRIVTNKPDLGHYSGGFNIGAEATMHGDPSASLSGVLNLPFIKDRLGLRIVGYGDRTGGYIDDIGGPKNVNSLTRQGGRGTLKLKANDDWSVTAGIVEQTINSADSQYVSVLSERLTRAVDLREPYDNDFLEGFATVDGSLPWANLTSTTSFLRHEINNRSDATTALPLFSSNAVGPAAFNDDTTVKMSTEEMRLSSPQGQRIRWIAGLFASQGTSQRDASLTSKTTIAPDNVPYQERREDRIREFALFGELYVPITRTITIGGGLRWFLSSVNTESVVTEPTIPLTQIFDERRTTSGLAPKFVISYQPSPQSLFYGQAAEGYRIGGFNTAGLVGVDFGNASSSPQPARRYGKDELWNYELGAKLTLFDGALHLRSAVFWAVWSNLQTDQLLPSGLLYTANAGDARNRGIEFEANYALRGLSLRSNFIVNDPELIHRDPSLPSRVDAALPGVPNWSAGLSISYVQWIANEFKAIFNGQINYTGSSHLRFDGIGGPEMGGYANAKLQVGLQKNRWCLTASIGNPADIRGNTFSYGNPFSVRANPQLTPLRPRTVGLSLSADF